MKPPNKSLSQQLFNPPFTENSPKSPLNALINLTQKLHSFSINNEILKPNTTSIQPKTISKITSFDPISSPYPQKDLAENTHLPFLSRKHNPITKTTSYNLIPSPKASKNEFGHTHLPKNLFYSFKSCRSFSSTPSDPFSAPANSKNSDSISSGSRHVVSAPSPPGEAHKTIDAGSSIRKPISLWPGMYDSPVTNALWEARSHMYERLSNAPVDAPPQKDLVPKTPSMSRTSIEYHFSSDYILREQYRNPWNEIRMGKLLEDLDALAGTISFKVITSFNR